MPKQKRPKKIRVQSGNGAVAKSAAPVYLTPPMPDQFAQVYGQVKDALPKERYSVIFLTQYNMFSARDHNMGEFGTLPLTTCQNAKQAWQALYMMGLVHHTHRTPRDPNRDPLVVAWLGFGTGVEVTTALVYNALCAVDGE